MWLNKLIFLSVILSKSAWAAPCCAGSSSIPALITADEAQLLSVSYSFGKVIGDAPGISGGVPVFRDDLSPSETHQNFALNYASLLNVFESDRIQAGVSIPVVSNEVKSSGTVPSESTTALGDVSFTLGYETLPEWEYSEWKPRIFSFAQVVAPTGRSTYESQKTLQTDVTGLGFWQTQLGSVAIKRWNIWDATAVIKLGHYFATQMTSGAWSAASSLGVGYSFGKIWRIGTSLEPNYLSPIVVNSIQTSPKLVWNTGVTLTALLGADQALVLSYNDQTWVGPAINTSLARTVGLTLQQRFER